MEPYVHPTGEITLLPPPEGYIVNFQNPQRQYDVEAYAVTGGLNAVTLLFIGQRVYVKAFIHRKLDWDDVFLAIAFGIITGLAAIILNAYAKALLGVHSWELPIDRMLKFVESLYPMPILYALFSMFAKLALATFYLRLSPQLWFRCAVWFVIFFIVGSNLGLAIAAAVPCMPVEKLWNSTLEGSCNVNLPSVYQATAITGVLADVSLIIIPVYMTVGLQMPLRQKIGLAILFGIGGITFVTSIIRLVYIINQLTELDQTWGAAPASVWAIIEAYLLMICATLPTIRVFFRNVAPRLIGELTGRSKSTPESGNKNVSIQTIGQRGVRRKYHRFGDAEYALDTIPNGNTGVERDGDSGSERAIIQRN